VLTLDANYDDVSGTATFTEQEHMDFRLALASVQESAKSLHPIIYDIIQNTTNLRRLIQAFVNNRVRNSDGSLYYNLNTEGFLAFLEGEQNKESADKLTERGRRSVAARYAQLSGQVAYFHDRFDALFRLHLAVSRTKNIIIHKLSQASDIRSFLPTESGFKVSGPEGFVAVCHDSAEGAAGHAVKLVDRLEFSRANFLHRDGN
jgi:hypothetical protein